MRVNGLSGFLPCPEERFLWVTVAAGFVGTSLPLPSPNSDQLRDQHWLKLVLSFHCSASFVCL